MSTAHKLGTDSIVCHAFNKDLTELAISARDNKVIVYSVPKTAQGKFEILSTLAEHSSNVTDIDWAKKTDRIVTSSADRNAYVWTRIDRNKWKPMLVILQINRAATCVRWSPLENKFAVGSASRTIAVCYFAEDNNWWVSKHIKKPIRSTVTCLDWHPDNALLACGSSDFKARVFSAYFKTVDEKPTDTNWGKKMTFQNLMFECGSASCGWVHGISFSHDGNFLSWVGHDSSITVAHARDPEQPPVITTLKCGLLPFTCVSWIGKTSLVAGGHDCAPILFRYKGENNLIQEAELDIKSEVKSGNKSARDRFKIMDKKGTMDDSDVKLDSTHQNAITDLRINGGDKSRANQISTVGVDGQLVFWDLRSLEKQIGALKIA